MALLALHLLLLVIRVSSDSKSELEALLGFKLGVSSSTGALADWSPTAPDPCSFSGVSCSGGEVTSLELPASGLQGSISPSLARLRGLKLIDLSGNTLSGSIPGELGSLPNLHNLHLAGNSLSGALPVELFNLATLVSLDLASNSVQGNLPPEFARLINLEELVLGIYYQLLPRRHSGNPGSIPETLGRLPKLRKKR